MSTHLTKRLAVLVVAGSLATSTAWTQSTQCTTTDGHVRPGIEALLADSLSLLRGKRVGLITNHSGRDRAGTSTIDLLHKAPGVRLTALFGPEHGIRGVEKAGAKIGNSVDSATGVRVYSLYGDTRVPTSEMLAGIDVLVYDIQDVGARVYTYPWTLALSAEAAAKAGKKFVVLDRPNPIRNDRIDGGVLNAAYRSFVGLYPVSARYGMTPGELLRYLVGTKQLVADIAVVPMCGYTNRMWYDETGIPWYNPSPNLRTMDAALLYPGTVFFEGTTLSEGRGTDAPFTQAGAPWLTDAQTIATALNARQLPGVHFDAAWRTVETGYKHGGLTIPMVRVRITDRDVVKPVDVGAWMLREIYRRHPREFEWREQSMDRLSGGDRLRRAVQASDDAVAAVLGTFQTESADFAQQVSPYRLYR